MHTTFTEGGAPPPLPRRENGAEAVSSVSQPKATSIAGSAGSERFKVVIYACVAGNANPQQAISECREYAEAFGWEATHEICDNTGLLPPQGRDGLATALDLVQVSAVGAVLTAYRSMISPRHDEFDEVAAEVEKRGGFLCVREAARPDAMPNGG
ncbi:recombinase family protein [Streptomyces sp. NPDC058470]|uniref:recombinase family protein n=1 Tax=Streptomyces sp. NPDC058470 TaxID=3346515 RepID=UPI003662753D